MSTSQHTLRVDEPIADNGATQPASTVSWAETSASNGDCIIGLVLITAMRPAQHIALGQSFTIGRTTDSDFCVSIDRQMSRRHFTIECTSEGGELVDLNSTNGTYVNGQRVSKGRLQNRDKIIAGMTVFALRIVFQEQ